MELAPQTHYAISPGAAEALYVATDLGFWKTDSPAMFCRDVQINDTAYRRLDPVYFAWLRSRLALAKEAAKSGRIDPAAFDELRNRFAGIEAWLLDHFGAQTHHGRHPQPDAAGVRPATGGNRESAVRACVPRQRENSSGYSPR